MKTKIILIGRSMAGKTTLCQYLTNEELRYKKTQTIQVIDCIVLVQQSTESGTMFPPGYATTFGKPCVGVVTKCDLGSREQIENAKKYLELAGAKKTFVTSSYTGEGFDAFLKYMEEMDSHA